MSRKAGDNRLEANALGNIALVYSSLGQYQKSFEYYSKCLPIQQRIGDVGGEANSLNNIGIAHSYLGQHQKALDYYEKSLALKQKIGNLRGQSSTLGVIGLVYSNLGQHEKALLYAEKSLTISRKMGNVRDEASVLKSMGFTYTQLGKFEAALEKFQQCLDLYLRMGAETREIYSSIAEVYMDKGELDKAEPYIKKSGNNLSYARLYLLKPDYQQAMSYYANVLVVAEKSQNASSLFITYTGLGKVHEALEDYKKSEEYYEKGMRLTEELRSGMLPSERRNFFEVKIGGFDRSEPAKGLTRVRMKQNLAAGSIESSEVTRARVFSDVISSRSESKVSGVPQDVLERENVLISAVAAIRKQLARTDNEKEPSLYENLRSKLNSSEGDLKEFVEQLRADYPSYAAVKYPRPVTLKESKLKPEEHVVIFDVSPEGVGVKLIKGKRIAYTFYTDWKSSELNRDIKKFRQPFEQLKLKEFDCELASTLYRKLLLAVLAQVPPGTPITIIPDGILATLPFEALVVSGRPTWEKVDKSWPEVFKDYPQGVTFLGDEYPISYYQSITALTLARDGQAKNSQNQKLLVMADPVFDLNDKRAQSVKRSQLSETDKRNNIALMQAIEESAHGTFRLQRLSKTTELANSLGKIYGTNCLALTGINANKADFLTDIAPTLDQYSGIVFATHGVMSTNIPGLMEPFLALTMAPPGTDGFLKMSDILSLKMNADIVALTACQTGLGQELSGEGVMSMGRAFQYAGARSVLISLWSVAESGSVLLTEKFFQHLKEGKNKLEALRAARDDVRNVGYKHPFFWSAFILVGETS